MSNRSLLKQQLAERILKKKQQNYILELIYFLIYLWEIKTGKYINAGLTKQL